LAMERLYKDGHALSNKIITKTRMGWRVFRKKIIGFSLLEFGYYAP
jgi:hypothetical protein